MREKKRNAFAKIMKDKRVAGTKRSNTKGSKDQVFATENILNNKEFVVSRLETFPSGKAQKYERKGPQEFASFTSDEVTLETLKESCNTHFKTRLPPG